MSQKFRKLMGNEEEGRFCGMLVKSAQDSMIVCDQSLNICFHNRAFLKLFGHTNGSYKNFSLLDFVPSLDQTDAKRAFDQLAYGKAPAMKIDANLVGPTGSSFRISGRVSRTRCKDNFLFYIVLRKVDKIAEETATASLALKHLPLMILETDRNLKISATCGTLWERFCGSTASIIGSRLGDSSCPHTPEFFRKVDYSELKAGHPVSALIEWNGESLDLSMQPIFDAKKQLLGTVGYITAAEKSENLEEVEEYIATRKVATTPRVVPLPVAMAPKDLVALAG